MARRSPRRSSSIAPPAASAHRSVLHTSVVLLVAGRSQRMVMQKALLRWGAKTMLEYQLTQLSAVEGVDEIVVVTGYRADRLAPIIERSQKARAVHNVEWEQG